jgi:hypothetical protein
MRRSEHGAVSGIVDSNSTGTSSSSSSGGGSSIACLRIGGRGSRLLSRAPTGHAASTLLHERS